MDFRTAIEHLRNAGLDAEANFFITNQNRAQENRDIVLESVKGISEILAAIKENLARVK